MHHLDAFRTIDFNRFLDLVRLRSPQVARNDPTSLRYGGRREDYDILQIMRVFYVEKGYLTGKSWSFLVDIKAGLAGYGPVNEQGDPYGNRI